MRSLRDESQFDLNEVVAARATTIKAKRKPGIQWMPGLSDYR